MLKQRGPTVKQSGLFVLPGGAYTIAPYDPETTKLKQFLIPSVTTLSVVAMGLVAVYPILFGPALPCTDDAAFHLLRLTQLDSLLQQGIWYSRSTGT